MISTSKASPRLFAATSASLKVTFTPMAKLGAITMPIFFDASAICCFCASVNPVVPMTMRTPAATHSSRWAMVASGRVKSMMTSPAAMATCASAPILTPQAAPTSSPASLPTHPPAGRSNAEASDSDLSFSTASIRVRPMRPPAPAITTFIWPPDWPGRQPAQGRPQWPVWRP